MQVLINVFFAAISPPSCEPQCGQNSHCVYGQSNLCKCDKGYTGNPYIKCLPRRQITCAQATCGFNAVCQQTKSHVECLCPPGYVGNPNLQCIDIDECSSKPCAENAVCINTPGSYSCICKSRYVGNPYELCSQVAISKCAEGSICTCSHNATCPEGYICDKSRCVNVCKNLECGPKAICEDGECVCLPGHNGNPHDLRSGCLPDNICKVDGDCRDSEICFQIAKNVRKCVDSCSKLQCGPNSLCVSASHQAHCICAEGFVGKPSDIKAGCQLVQKEPEVECNDDNDCDDLQVCVAVDGTQNRCLDLCSTIACSANEVCRVIHSNARCECKQGFLWNPVSSVCEQPSTPNCDVDADCESSESCQKDVLGVNKCKDSCLHFTCPPNSKCVTKNHKSQCECLLGYNGNPNEREGCVALNRNQCSDDAQCRESEICKSIGNIKKCSPACQQVLCGPNAICVTNNHVAKCQCPAGPFTGNANDLAKGCQSVPCIYNTDCQSHELCNRMTHSCLNACGKDTCGENSVCLAENHKTTCLCPSGYRADPVPEVNCKKIESCNPNPCHSSAICEPRSSSYVCKCPIGYFGDPTSEGCKKQGECLKGDDDCPADANCVNNRCVNPCDGACGINSLCKIVGRKAICICPDGYENVQGGNACKKRILTCSSEFDCEGDICSNGQCFAACMNSSQCDLGESCIKNFCVTQCSKHSQCGIGQACVSGQCLVGCRSNEDCPSDESCVNNNCVNPCQATRVCGPNAICTRINHSTKCECPPGFEGTPTPQQGCVRKSSSCIRSSQCPPDHMCIGLLCQVPCRDHSGCAIGEKCSDNICHKICHSSSNCLHGEHCSFGICIPGCKADSDCSNNQVCKSMECQCQSGFEYVKDECINVNECLNNPCHPSAQCIDTQGAYKCICSAGAVGDPYKMGCLLPNQCRRDSNCEDSLACINGKCANPCNSNGCGLNAICSVLKHRITCSCEKGYLGNPLDKNIGCFRVECVDDVDCSSDKYCDMKSNKCTGKSLFFLFLMIVVTKSFIKYLPNYVKFCFR